MSGNLRQASEQLMRASLDARAWVQETAATAPSVANQSHSLVGAARRAANLGRKLSGAAGRRTCVGVFGPSQRLEEHTSELQSLMRISYAVFCLKKKKTQTPYKNSQ